jgi:beta-N-acetylhexosaminidase
MNGGAHLLLGIRGPELTPGEAERFRRLQPAGYILFSRNIATPAQTRALTDSLRSLSYDTPIIAIDQEGGRVSRTTAVSAAPPSAPALAASGDYAAIADTAAHTADQLRLLGINLDLAPVFDLDHHPDTRNALTGRSWGRDPQRVIDYAGHWNRWLRKRHIATCGKHFPAGGRAASDPHHNLPVSTATWAELLREDILPYTALMPELDAVMLAHVEFPELDPHHPASLSPHIVGRLLRGQLGFDRHLVLTDDLDMGAITRRYGRGEDARLAIAAGCDLALICHETDSADQAAAAIEQVPLWQREESTKRIDRLRKKLTVPPIWSDKTWEKTHNALAELATRFDSGDTTPPASPVQNY